MLKSMSKSQNRYFYHIFVSTGDAPGAITLNVVWWKENSMLTNCLAACAHLTITLSEIQRDIGRKSSFFHTPLHSTPLLGGSRRNIGTPFGMEKLEWCGYLRVKRDRQTDRQTHTRTDTARRNIPHLCTCIAR